MALKAELARLRAENVRLLKLLRLIAISGHRGLPAPTVRLVDQAIRAALAEHAPDVTGLSCLADGPTRSSPAPSPISAAPSKPSSRPPSTAQGSRHTRDSLFAQAADVRRLPFTASTPESHMAASKLMVDEADELYAVWEGESARAYGGAADVVAYAREHGTPVRVIWPDGAQRG